MIMDDEEISDKPMSDDEEDYLDKLLNDELEEDTGDQDFDPRLLSHSEASSQCSESTSASQDPLARPDLYWKDENDSDDGQPDPRTVPFRPKRVPGLQIESFTRNAVRMLTRPLDFLMLFLTELVVMDMCIATNHTAESLIGKGINTSYANSSGAWDRITVDEMYRFIGVVIYMSIVDFNTIERYWRTDPLYKTGVAAHAMTVTRFKAILSFLHINADIEKDDKLTHVRSLIDHTQKISQRHFQPFQSLSADERMVASKHKFSGIRQFIKDKPIRFGIKLWVLADALTGYTYSFFVYLGKKRTEIVNKSKGLAYNVVMELTKDFYGQGYTLYTDSFYTTLHLAKDLLENKVYLVGAVKRTSSAMPQCFKDIIGFDKCASRGDFRWHRENEFVFVQWKDCKMVTILSPVHKGSATTTCYRTVTERSGIKKKKICQPVLIHDYNQGMGGVDKSNQMLNEYSCYIRSQQHWWKVLFFHCLDIMIVNSFILLREFAKKYPDQICDFKSDWGQLEYRESLVSSILHLETLRVTENVTHSIFANCRPDVLDKRADCSFCNASAALKGMKLPSVKTSMYCTVCKVPLCIYKGRNCYQRWHSVDGKSEREWVEKFGRKRIL